MHMPTKEEGGIGRQDDGANEALKGRIKPKFGKKNLIYFVSFFAIDICGIRTAVNVAVIVKQ